ncbi:MGMT family protein [Candidatus Aenigmatarchaeota archaeon]
MHKAIKLLAKIPKGKITTYKELALTTKSSPRAIGQVMRNNKDGVKYPCYKVICSDGSLGGYGGKTHGKNIKNKIRKLESDGIVIKNSKINLKKYLHKF